MRVSSIWHYPVKSCQGIALSEAEIDVYGVTNDRLFVIATSQGKVLTQKTLSMLNLISTGVTERGLVLGFPGKPEITVALEPVGATVTVDMYGTMPGECMGAEVAAWLSDILARDCRLVRSHTSFSRKISPQAAHLFLPVQERYPDASPIHLIGSSSLEDL